MRKDRIERFHNAVIDGPSEDFGRAPAAWLATPATGATSPEPKTPSMPEPKAATRRSRKTAGQDEPNDAPTTLPAEIARAEAPTAGAVQEQVERLVLRTAKAGA